MWTFTSWDSHLEFVVFLNTGLLFLIWASIVLCPPSIPLPRTLHVCGYFHRVRNIITNSFRHMAMDILSSWFTSYRSVKSMMPAQSPQWYVTMYKLSNFLVLSWDLFILLISVAALMNVLPFNWRNKMEVEITQTLEEVRRQFDVQRLQQMHKQVM